MLLCEKTEYLYFTILELYEFKKHTTIAVISNYLYLSSLFFIEV